MKKLIQIISIFLLVSLMMVNTGCDPSDFDDLNVNPNATEVPPTSALLTNVLSGMAAPASFLTTGLFAQYYSETQYTDASLYATPLFGWDGVYAGPLYDIQNIINNNTDPATAERVAVNGSNNNQIALARILKVFQYMYLTDEFGDLPYSEALTGKTDPAYDTQESIYKGMFKELGEAVAQFDNGLAPKGDIIYGGDVSKWQKAANSLRVILALRVSKADPALGSAEVKAALAAVGGVIETNDDNLSIDFPGGAAFRHPWFNTYNGRKDYAISDVIVNVLKEGNDLRLLAFGNPNAKNEVIGFPYGVPREQAIAFTNDNPDYSFVLKSSLRTDGSIFHIISASQVYLARAEAAQLGWTSESASDMYTQGIQASWEQWGVYDAALFSTFIADPKISLTTGDELAKIGTQRWLSFFPDGTQGWSEWRRTGYPDLKPTPFATNASKQIPTRLPYPTSEPNLNAAGYNSAVSRISGGDTQDGKVWWDK